MAQVSKQRFSTRAQKKASRTQPTQYSVFNQRFRLAEKFEGTVNCFANFFLITKDLNKECKDVVFGNAKRDKYKQKLSELPYCFRNVVVKQDFTNLVEGVENMRDEIIAMCEPVLNR